jgi:hypothetical protein
VTYLFLLYTSGKSTLRRLPASPRGQNPGAEDS